MLMITRGWRIQIYRERQTVGRIWELLIGKIERCKAHHDRATSSDITDVESHRNIAPELQLATTGASATFVASMSGQVN